MNKIQLRLKLFRVAKAYITARADVKVGKLGIGSAMSNRTIACQNATAAVSHS